MKIRKDEVIGWLRAGYDKIVLVVVLAAILISLLILIFSTGREKKSLSESHLPPPISRAKPKTALMTSAQDAVEMIQEPFQIGGWTTRMVVSEMRVNCVKCGRPIPVNAETCTFSNCRAQQPKIVSSKTRDSDFDGMPDEWENRYGLGVNIDDAAQDADGDRFTNLEEYLAGTNPKDASSAPPLVSKLRVLKTGRIPLPLLFGGVQQLTKDDTLFLLKNKKTGRDNYARMNETIDGYKITGYEKKTTKVRKGTFDIEEDASVLKLSKDGKIFELPLSDKAGAQGEQAASLINLVDNTKMTVKKGDIISLKNNKYKVVDITAQNVIVADMQSGAEITLDAADGLVK